MGKFHPSICSPIQITVLKTVSKPPCLWDSLPHPTFPSRASKLLAHGWQQGEQQVHGKCLLIPLVPTTTAWELPRGSAGRSNSNSTKLLHPKNTGCSTCQLQHREHNQDPERARSTNVAPAKLQNFMTWEAAEFFPKTQLTYSTLLAILCPDQRP